MIIFHNPESILKCFAIFGPDSLTKFEMMIWKSNFRSNLVWYYIIWMHILCNEQKHDDLEFGTGLSLKNYGNAVNRCSFFSLLGGPIRSTKTWPWGFRNKEARFWNILRSYW